MNFFTDRQILFNVLEKYKCYSEIYFSSEISKLKSDIKEWAKTQLEDDLKISGSKAKGTAISLSSDFDLFVPLKSNTIIGENNDTTLENIYDNLCNFLKTKNYVIKKQNVSLKIELKNLSNNILKTDITPAKKEDSVYNYHYYWLYCNRGERNRVRTNIKVHIDEVSRSNRINEIKLIKILRKLHDIDFPSIYLEFLLIKKILKGKNTGDDYLVSNFKYILEELSKNENNPLFERLEDPANSNNILSDLLTNEEKTKIINKIKNIKLKSIQEIFI